MTEATQCSECSELRKRRDDLLAANNRLVEERRSMAQDRDRMALRCEQLFRGYNSAYGRLSQLRVDLRALIRQHGGRECPLGDEMKALGLLLDSFEAAGAFFGAAHDPRPLADYHDDLGPVLWWRFPVKEPPYYGTPANLGIQVSRGRYVGRFPDYVTHFTMGPDGNRVQHRYEEIERAYTVECRPREEGDSDE